MWGTEWAQRPPEKEKLRGRKRWKGNKRTQKLSFYHKDICAVCFGDDGMRTHKAASKFQGSFNYLRRESTEERGARSLNHNECSL